MAEPSLADLLRARDIAARVVQYKGEKYWSHFDRIDRACQERMARQERLREVVAEGLATAKDAGDQVSRERQGDL